ncbi:MAG: hypothetical protein ACRD16_11950 [Thermoanaerobaculia bacterium]
MRYAIQPAMKEHRDVSMYRDFAILTPAAADPEVERSLPDAVAASAAAFHRGHPGVVAIFPVPEGARPYEILQNPLGQPVLVVRIGQKVMGLVLEGHGRTNGEL